MLNNHSIYAAFNSCKKIYGLSEVHVQLIAKQLGVLAKEVVDVIDANPTLYTTRMNLVNSNYSNPVSGNEFSGLIITGITAIPFISTVSVIREGDNGGTITLSISGGTFTSSTSTNNWTIAAGNTNLTLASVGTGTTTKVLTFTGVAQLGTLSIQCKAAGITGGASASDTLYYEVPAVAVDYSTISSLATRMTAMEAITSQTIVDGIDLSTEHFDVALIEDYEDYANIYLVVATTDTSNSNILLPPSTGSMRKIIVTNQTVNTIKAVVDGNDVINIAETDIDVATEASITLIDFAEGKWATT